MQKDLDDRGQDSRGSVVVLLVVKLASSPWTHANDQTRPLTMAPVAKLKQGSQGGLMVLIVVSIKSL